MRLIGLDPGLRLTGWGVIDSDGNIRNIYSSGTLDPRLVLADVRTLMIESAQSRSKTPKSGPRSAQNITSNK